MAVTKNIGDIIAYTDMNTLLTLVNTDITTHCPTNCITVLEEDDEGAYICTTYCGNNNSALYSEYKNSACVSQCTTDKQTVFNNVSTDTGISNIANCNVVVSNT